MSKISLALLVTMITCGVSSTAIGRLDSTWPSKALMPATREQLQRSIETISFGEHIKGQSHQLIFATYEPVALRRKKETVFRPSVVRLAGSYTSNAVAEFVSWPEAVGYDWVYAAQLSEKGYYWGFLDYGVEGRIGAIKVVRSLDGGKTWERVEDIRKFYWDDSLVGFSMDLQGKGYAVVQRSGTGTDAGRGFDFYATSDFGKTWAKPQTMQSQVYGQESERPADCGYSWKPTKKVPSECPTVERHLKSVSK